MAQDAGATGNSNPGSPVTLPHVLLVGLDPVDRDRFLGGIKASGTNARVMEAASLHEALSALSAVEAQCVIAGTGAATAGWEAAGEELRRMVPNAALVAVTGASGSGASWDDVIRPHERDLTLLARVVRSGLVIAETRRRLVQWAMRDPLTDLLNRRGLERVLTREASDRERGQGPLAVLLIDCDDFKDINDKFGLPIGDDVLRGVADALIRSVRARDTVARVGGDEFLVLLPHTRTWEAVEVAERIRTKVRESVTLPDGGHLTVSIGVRRLDDRITKLRGLVEATQAGLKQSKAAGKDQVRVVDDRGTSSAAVNGVAAGIAPKGIDPEESLPPGARLFLFECTLGRDLGTGAPSLRLLTPALSASEGLALSTHRATQSAWDLHWFSRGLAQVPATDLPVHLGLYPATLLEVPGETFRAMISGRVPFERLTVSIDDQFIAGDPSVLAARLWPLRGFGLSLCIEVSDLGKGCFESLILLRPEKVLVDASLVRGVATSRIRRNVLHRFVRVCDALGIQAIAGGLDAPNDRTVAFELGVRHGLGEAVGPVAAPPEPSVQ